MTIRSTSNGIKARPTRYACLVNEGILARPTRYACLVNEGILFLEVLMDLLVLFL